MQNIASEGIQAQRSMLLKTGSVLLILWGLLNLIGGAAGALDHPSSLVLPLFAITGTLITSSGIGFWRKKKWAVPAAVIGLPGLSLAALYSASVLHGWSDIRISHHITRLAVSGLIFAIAVIGKRRAARYKENHSDFPS
jgi:hypothetical protein